jgi:thioredoxin-dependent peroxiredoxin
MDLGHRLQDADLVRGARAATGQDQSRARNVGAAVNMPLPLRSIPLSRSFPMLALRRILVTALVAVVTSVCAQTPDASPAEGTAAPDFKLQDQKGEWHTLSQYQGKWVVLYFYPKDNTPGCTMILGVSVDDVESHKKFSAEHKLPFDILADSEKTVSGKYGVLFSAGPMKLASRQTFLIDPSGKIVKHWPKVDPKGHSEMVLAEIKAHSPAKTG